MVKKTLSLVSLMLLIVVSSETFAQNRKPSSPVGSANEKSDAKPGDAKKEPKPYKKVIDSTAVTQRGLIDVHKIDTKYLFEIPVSLLGTEMMTFSMYSKTPAGGCIFGGEEINRQVVRWEKG